MGVYTSFERSFFDVRVTHPNCASNEYKTLPEIYKEHENQKKAMYEERVLQAEKGSFTPLVFTTSGGMGPMMTVLLKKLADTISAARSELYSHVMNHLRNRLCFSLLRCILVALRGVRGNSKRRCNQQLINCSCRYRFCCFLSIIRTVHF